MSEHRSDNSSQKNSLTEDQSTAQLHKKTVSRLDLQIDLTRLHSAATEILKKYPLHQDQRQLCFHSNKIEGDNVFEGVGSFYDNNKKAMRANDRDYIYLIKEFQGTYFEEILNLFKHNIARDVFRMRLMLLPPKTCYSFHYDLSCRYHIAIETHPTAFIIFEDEPPYHIPADGFVYRTNTKKWHTAVNCSEVPRLHLVVCAEN